jgi:hypothetical protein
VTAASYYYTKPEECNTNEKKPEEASGKDETPHDHHQRSPPFVPFVLCNRRTSKLTKYIHIFEEFTKLV